MNKNNQQNDEKATGTGVSIQGQFTQADIPQLLEQVNAKISELSKGNDKKIVITVQLPGFGDVSKIDSLGTLLQACASIEGKKEFFGKVADKYLPTGVKTPKLVIAGHSTSEWLEYLQERINEVAYQKELEKLRTIKKTLEENLSQEAKLANDLKKVAEILAD